MTTDCDPPRYVPQRPFPSYSYVTGRFPHPIRDPQGHSFGLAASPEGSLDPENWMFCTEYLFAIDLFNHGYYWEAHEHWELLWQAAGREGLLADFLKGLIKLAAAGVKAREDNIAGVRRHAGRARDLFRLTEQKLQSGQEHFCGLPLGTLQRWCQGLESGRGLQQHNSAAAVEIVFAFQLRTTAAQ